MTKHRHPRTIRGRALVMKFDRMGRRVEYIEAVRDDATDSVVTNKHQRFVYDGYFLPVALITELRIVQHQLKFVGYNEAIVYFLIDCLKSKDSCKSLSCGKLELIKQWFEIVSNNKLVIHDEMADKELWLLILEKLPRYA